MTVFGRAVKATKATKAAVRIDEGDVERKKGESVKPRDENEHLDHEDGPEVVEMSTIGTSCHESVDDKDQGGKTSEKVKSRVLIRSCQK